MFGIEVNPVTIRKGDTIATKYKETYDPETDSMRPRVIHSRKVKDTKFCPTAPEFFHLDGDCYDTRFATVIHALT
jgi:hypothetical protein